MKATIQTPLGSKTLHVCKDGDGNNPEWLHIYEVSFPEGQRQSLDQIRAMLGAGTMELDETRDQEEHVMCLTLTEVFRDKRGEKAPRFLLACYTATLPAMRSLGIGSIHRRRLVELLQGEYPDYLGIIGEIESTKEPGLPPDVLTLRKRRLAFFLRLGSQPLPVDYRFPSFVSGEKPLMGELLFTPFAAPALDRPTLSDILRRIYVEGYGLEPDDPFIDEVLAQFAR